MSRLRLQAAASSGAAADGNREPLNFTVSVTQHDGDAVDGLDADAFDLQAFIIGPGGPPSDLAALVEPQPGVYVFQAFPRRPWADGTYLYVLTVEAHGDRGQTVIPATVPES